MPAENLKIEITERALQNLRNCQNYLNDILQARGEFTEMSYEDRIDIHQASALSFIHSLITVLSLGGRVSAEDDKSFEFYGGALHGGMIFFRNSREWSVHT